MKITELKKELQEQILKREKIREAQMERYHKGTATRRRTTTSNAAADFCNDEIEYLRSEIRKHNA